jgi:FtsH-binding integral membrane protein
MNEGTAMAMGPERGYLNPARTDVGQIDAGLRQYMLSVYNYMAGGLAVTGVIAFLIASSPDLQIAIWSTPLRYVAMFAPVAVVLFFSFRIQKMSFGTAQLTYWVYAALMGLSLSFIFLAYTGTSIARVFFITSAAFGATSLYGYTTKRDLTKMGSFLFMGLIGIVLASLVNIFLASSALQFAISVVGVIVFTGLTATSRLFEPSPDPETVSETRFAVLKLSNSSTLVRAPICAPSIASRYSPVLTPAPCRSLDEFTGTPHNKQLTWLMGGRSNRIRDSACCHTLRSHSI